VAVSGVIALALLNLMILPQAAQTGDHNYVLSYALLGGITIGIAAWTRVFDLVTRLASGAAKLGAALPLVTFAFLLTSPEFPESREPSPFPAAAVKDEAVGPVYIFLFNAMDRDLTFAESAAGHTPTLHHFAAHSTFFEASVSAGHATAQSVPRLLFQSPAQFNRTEDGHYEANGTDTRRLPSIFESLNTGRTAGVVGGWYHDYGMLLGDQVQWVRDSSYTRPAEVSLGASINFVVYLASAYGFVPMVRGLSGINDFMMHTHVGIARDVHEQAIETVRNGGDDVVGFFHYPVPHAPYLFDRDGLRDRASIDATDAETGYLRNLEYTDRLLGELLAAIHDSGRWDRSTIIVTSDHGLDNSRANVLAVKMPGQQAGRVVLAPLANETLVDWLRTNGLKR
jgi:hypothetical protein